jgi:hypothetical protein
MSRHFLPTTASAEHTRHRPRGRGIDLPSARQTSKLLMIRQIANALPLLTGVKDELLSAATSTGGFYGRSSRSHALSIPQ